MFEEHVEQVQGLPEAARWTIERQDGFVVHATLSPRSSPQELFVVRLGWTDYPGRLPASVIFLNPETRERGATQYWPKIPGVRAPNDICACWTAEGFVAHPEWLGDANMAWDPGENAILTQLRYVQHELDFNYQGPSHV